MKRLIALAIPSTLCMMAMVSSCVTGSSDKRPEGVVVERNKQTRPAWADSPTNKLLVSPTETRFHHVIVKQRDLPIAVKRAQTDAVASSFDLWSPGFNQRLSDLPQINGLRSSPRTSKEMETALNHVAHKIHSEVAQVEDIYYERVRIDNYATVPELQGVTEYFDVHVLVQLMPVDGDRLKTAVSDALINSKPNEMRRVGRELAPPSGAKKTKSSQ